MTELKPCPFCGGEAELAIVKLWNHVYCERCHSRTTMYSSEEQAIEAWNKRPSPWHTGTPTEEGWYLVAYECVYDCKNKGKIEYFTLNIITDEYGYRDYRGRASDDVWKAVAWQKIEPYEASKERE